MRTALACLVLLAAAGCDSADDELRLNADYYVGSWELVSVTDGSGDQTATVGLAVDELVADFEQDRGFRLEADLNDVLNTVGQDDIVIEGTYQAQPDVPALVLIADVDGTPLAPSFRASGATEQQVSLTAPAAIVGELLGPLDQLSFTGDVTLTVRRI